MYSVGQIITKEEHIAFANYCAANQPNLMTEPVGDGTYRIVEIPAEPEPVPTRSQMHELRKQAYAETTDKLTLEKLRLQTLGLWTEQKEDEYIDKIGALSAEIKKKYPFSHKRTPTDQVGQGQEQEPESLGA